MNKYLPTTFPSGEHALKKEPRLDTHYTSKKRSYTPLDDDVKPAAQAKVAKASAVRRRP